MRDTRVVEAGVPGFLPSRDGFRFANRWPATPALWLGRGYLRLGVGNAANGLCGGMCFVVRDRFEAGDPVPQMDAPPAAGTPLFAEIVARQVDSLDRLVGLPARFWALAAMPQRARIARTIRHEWPKVRASIDAGRLAMLGLLRSVGPNPFLLGRNHQVAAWGYRLEPGLLTLRIYDPNWPGRDDVAVEVHVGRRPSPVADGRDRPAAAGPDRPVAVMAQSTGEPLRGFLAAPWVEARRAGR